MALTTKEKTFADEFIFLYFNSNEKFRWELTRQAAVKAKFELPDNEIKAQEESKKLYKKPEIKAYIDERYNHFNTLLKDNKRDVWNAIKTIS